MTKTLLMDAFPIRLSLDEGANGKMIARGEFGRADRATQNGRIYPLAIYEREIKKLQENVGKRRVFGELDHPADGKTKLTRASHVITKLTIDGDGVVMGEAEILDTPNGRTLKAILDANAEVGVSSRGFGSTKQGHDGQQVVGEDFMLRTFDFVADPAMKSAYPGIFTEDVDDQIFCAASLEESFPDLAEELRKDEREKVETALNDMLVVERAKAKDELRDEFGRLLVDRMTLLREEVETTVREQLCEDPDVAGSKAVLAQIASMVSDYRQEENSDVQATKDAIKAKDLEISKISEEMDRAKGVARQAIFRAQLEQAIGGHPRHDTIVELIGDPGSYEDLEELQDRVGVLKGEMEGLAEEHDNQELATVQAQLDEQESLLSTMKSDRKNLRRQIKALKSKLDEALDLSEDYRTESLRNGDLAEEASLRAYKNEKARGFTNSSKLMDLLEGASDERSVDRIVRTTGRNTMRDSSLEGIRNRLRGASRETPEALNEDDARQAGPASVFGDLSMGDFRSLAGINKH